MERRVPGGAMPGVLVWPFLAPFLYQGWAAFLAPASSPGFEGKLERRDLGFFNAFGAGRIDERCQLAVTLLTGLAGYKGLIHFQSFALAPHPMQFNEKTALIVGVLVVLAVAAWALTRPAKSKLAAPTAIPVRVVSVAQQDIPRFVSGIGSVLSLHSVVIRPQVDGILTKLLVKKGNCQGRLDQAKAQLGESQAQLQVALVNLKRYKALSVDDGVSKQTYDQQQALVNQLKATAQGNQAAIDSAQRYPGPVFRDPDRPDCRRVLPATADVATLQGLIAAPTQASVDAYLGADTDGQTGDLLGEGHLSLIDNQISSTTGTLRAKAEFNNASQRLWPGQLVTIRSRPPSTKTPWWLPPTVVQRGLDSHFVYRVNGDKVDVVPVQVTYQDSDVNIIKGVQAGDVLVSDGQSRLKAGAQWKSSRSRRR
ncbi:multidrug resistance protein MdtA [Ditylenchus destructor]|nr:multidrug resistance protein MdtA [Ditylenchus destructor]